MTFAAPGGIASARRGAPAHGPRGSGADARATVRSLAALVLAAAAAAVGAHSQDFHDGAGEKPAAASPTVLAPGYRPLNFQAPVPGTYRLPPLKPAANGDVLTVDGEAARLHDYYGDKLVLLSFVYTSCSDAGGCPLATAVLHQVKQRLDREADVAGELRLLTLSFDPERDTPEVMRGYGAGAADGPLEWRFLTTHSMQSLQPILSGYDQSIARERDAGGRNLGTFAHVLRVYLIDRERRIRNIYSVSFLHAETLINDVKTLLAEDAAPVAVASRATPPPLRLHGAGDDRRGYESTDYVTRSKDLTRRPGRAADLFAIARETQLGLPAMAPPPDNPLTPARIRLGRKLFFDRRLSLNDTFSCAMCHIPEQGFTSNELATAVGIEGRTVRRNAPTLYNVGFMERLFHDARESTLEQQVWAPMLAQNEMGNPSIGYVIDKIRRMPDYTGLFEAAFANRGPGMETVGMAIASYERTLISGASSFDRWYYAGEQDALDERAQRGFALFAGRGRCTLCHSVGAQSALFSDQLLHNTGIGYRRSTAGEPATRRLQLAPGVYVDVETAAYAAAAETAPADLGRYEITQDPADRWKYRTPSLRNVALTAPYMHDGSLATLRDVVAFYNEGGVPNENLDPLMHPLGLTHGEISDLVVFLESLTGGNVDALIADAFAAPVGDARR